MDKVGRKKGTFELERLPIGKYTIELMAKNEDDVASSILQIPVKIHPPFYLTWWFLSGSFVVIIIIISIIVKRYINKIKRRNIERLNKHRLETRALNAELKAIRSQMNPHFIFNVLTAIQAKVISGKSSEA